MQLIAAQLAALLQLTQLWTVLGRLAPPAVGNTDDSDDHQGEQGRGPFSPTKPWQKQQIFVPQMAKNSLND